MCYTNACDDDVGFDPDLTALLLGDSTSRLDRRYLVIASRAKSRSRSVRGQARTSKLCASTKGKRGKEGEGGGERVHVT